MWRCVEDGFAAWKYLHHTRMRCKDNRLTAGEEIDIHETAVDVHSEDLARHLPLAVRQELGRARVGGAEERDMVVPLRSRDDVQIRGDAVRRGRGVDGIDRLSLYSACTCEPTSICACPTPHCRSEHSDVPRRSTHRRPVRHSCLASSLACRPAQTRAPGRSIRCARPPPRA